MPKDELLWKAGDRKVQCHLHAWSLSKQTLFRFASTMLFGIALRKSRLCSAGQIKEDKLSIWLKEPWRREAQNKQLIFEPGSEGFGVQWLTRPAIREEPYSFDRISAWSAVRLRRSIPPACLFSRRRDVRPPGVLFVLFLCSRLVL